MAAASNLYSKPFIPMNKMGTPSLFTIAAAPELQVDWNPSAQDCIASLFAVVENTPACVKMITKDGILLDMNAAGLALIEADCWESVNGANVYDLMVPEHLESFKQFNARVIAGNKESLEFEIISLKGTRRWMKSAAVPLKTSDGEVVHLAITSEVTAEKRQQTALREITTALDASNDCVFMFDAETLRFIYTNNGATRQVGYTADELKSMTPLDIKPSMDMRGFREMLRPLHENPGQSIVFRTKHQHRDGHLIPVEISVQLMPELGKAGRFIAIVHDITERLQEESRLKSARLSAEAANMAKSEFLANMSHEIRTPMNGIIGMTELALDSGLNADQRELVEMVRSSADTLLYIINDILDFSKIEAGKLTLHSSEIAIQKLVDDTLKMLTPKSHAKQIELISDVASDVPNIIKGDPVRLRQILVNLVGNAVKFTETGEVCVRISRNMDENAAESLYFEVTDTGPGISACLLDKIFEPFVQADGSSTRSHGGTGLGLSITSQLIDLMGGRIWATSREDYGSTFHFLLPFESSKGIPQANQLPPIRVLVVESNSIIRSALDRELRKWGLSPDIFADATTALPAMQKALQNSEPYSLLITDTTLPDVNGVSLIETLEADERHCNLPTIVISRDLAARKTQKCGKLQVVARLSKPIQYSELHSVIREIAERNPLQRNRDQVSVTAGNGLSDVQASFAPSVDSVAGNLPDRQLKILLVEDNVINQAVATRMLTKQGNKVVLATNGKLALAALEAESFDLIFMDVQMPVLDGYMTTVAIRQREQTLGGHIPIIAMTAHALKDDRDRCIAFGMDDYISKPIRSDNLRNAIARVMMTNDSLHEMQLTR